MYLKDIVIVASADVTFYHIKVSLHIISYWLKKLIIDICMKKELLTISKFMLCLRLP